MLNSKYVTATFVATAILMAPLSAAATLSSGALKFGAITLSPVIETKRIEIAGTNDYERCASLSIRVFNACLGQASNQSAKIRSCRGHYQDNLGRCRAHGD